MSLRDRSNPTVAYSRPAATFIILHFPCVLFSEGGLGCIASQAVMKYAITIRKNKTGLEIILNRFVVPRTRLELTRRKPALPPQSSVSTNSTTWASAFAERSGSNHAYEPVSPKGCANIVTILFFPKYTAKKLPGHETDPAIRRCFRSVRRSRQRAARLLRKTVYSAKSISSKR